MNRAILGSCALRSDTPTHFDRTFIFQKGLHAAAEVFPLQLSECQLLGIGVNAAGGKDKDAPKDKKYEVPKNAIAGKVKSVDLKAAKFTITLMNTRYTKSAITFPMSLDRC